MKGLSVPGIESDGLVRISNGPVVVFFSVINAGTARKSSSALGIESNGFAVVSDSSVKVAAVPGRHAFVICVRSSFAILLHLSSRQPLSLGFICFALCFSLSRRRLTLPLLRLALSFRVGRCIKSRQPLLLSLISLAL